MDQAQTSLPERIDTHQNLGGADEAEMPSFPGSKAISGLANFSPQTSATGCWVVSRRSVATNLITQLGEIVKPETTLLRVARGASRSEFNTPIKTRFESRHTVSEMKQAMISAVLQPTDIADLPCQLSSPVS
ncbi:hypothetical protein PG985_002322 [Apiospora marii]|uniref:Uncharacterized protein n=1 Tax=Apiospora marii TaxID=335849 RepID=A0ABR1RSQ4_9PEZI